MATISTTPYTPLDPPQRQIRLLKIIPGDDGTQICCTLATFDLYQPMTFSGSSNTWAFTSRERLVPEFTSLSYTWGTASENHQISLNGHQVPVRSNLWAFLQEVRHSSEYQYRFFWIDSLCIDQSNTTERMHQVGRMAHIYRKAKEVLVWLGPASQTSDFGIDTLSLIEERSSDELVTNHAQEHNIHSILKLCERSYWGRLWVLQELASAKDAMVMCGRKRLPLRQLAGAVQRFTQLGIVGPSNLLMEPLLRSPAISMLKQVQTNRSSLWNLIMATTHLGCAEPRDQVFALLNIVEQGHENIRPDYNMDMPALLNAVLRNEFRVRPPHSLSDAYWKCVMLEETLAPEPNTVFRMDEALGIADCIAMYPLVHKDSDINLWWALVYGHQDITSLWLFEAEANLSLPQKRSFTLQARTTTSHSSFYPNTVRTTTLGISRRSPHFIPVLYFYAMRSYNTRREQRNV